MATGSFEPSTIGEVLVDRSLLSDVKGTLAVGKRAGLQCGLRTTGLYSETVVHEGHDST